MRTLSLALAVPLVAVFAGCGGKTSDAADPGATGDSGVIGDTGLEDTPMRDAPSDAPPVSAGWHSYDVTITGGSVDWTTSGGPSPGDLPTTFTTKWTGRMDVHATTVGVIDRAVISPPNDDSTEFRLVAGGTTLLPVGDVTGVSFASDSDSHLSVRLRSMIQEGAIDATGDANYVEGDVVWTGKAKFTVVRAEDGTKPTWTQPIMGAFADLPLPWEIQNLTVSEPVDQDATGPMFTSTIHASISPIMTTPTWLGDTVAADAKRLRGISVVTDQWDSAASWKISAPSLVDYAHNALDATSLAPKTAQVLTLEASRVTGDMSLSLGHTWGKIEVDPKCHDGTTACWHLGSIKASYCSRVTEGGIALALSGSPGKVAVEVRAIAKSTIAGMGGAPPGSFAYMQRAIPGATPVTEAIDFGTVASTGDTWDTGWKRIEKPLPTGPKGSSAGVALSVGGMGGFGSAGSFDCGGPAPPPWDMDVYVRLVEIVP
jgi:hypothetical protein